MSLIRCPECNHEVSSYATECPNCKYPISKMEKKDIFDSGNTIDFRYQDEPIYKAAKMNFYATFGIIISVLLLFFGVFLMISMVYIIGTIVLTFGLALTIISSIYLAIAKNKQKEAENN